jgi:hypothetical protein
LLFHFNSTVDIRSLPPDGLTQLSSDHRPTPQPDGVSKNGDRLRQQSKFFLIQGDREVPVPLVEHPAKCFKTGEEFR